MELCTGFFYSDHGKFVKRDIYKQDDVTSGSLNILSMFEVVSQHWL